MHIYSVCGRVINEMLVILSLTFLPKLFILNWEPLLMQFTCLCISNNNNIITAIFRKSNTKLTLG